MTSFDVLDRRLITRGRHFLEASAGTGKTFAIEQVVARLLIEGDDPLEIDQILIVTFTRAAARELKMRIRANLESLLNRQEFDYVRALWETGEKKRASRCISMALASFDRAQIFTIHGFCYRCLSESAFEGNGQLELPDPDEGDVRIRLRQKILDFLRTRELFCPEQLELLTRKYSDLNKLLDRVIDLMEKRGEFIPPPTWEQQHAAFVKQLYMLPFQKTQFWEAYHMLAKRSKKLLQTKWRSQAELFAEILEKKSCSLQEFQQLIGVSERFYEKLTIPPTFPGKELFSIILDCRNTSQMVFALALECKKEINLFSTPDEMLYRMQDALDNPQFVEKVQGRYLAAIIDEFQDTDPIQWNILSRLFLDSSKAFYLVGDPKQSIYSFRKADLKTYFHAKDQMGEDAAASLDKNFRSDPALVEALNALFTHDWMEIPSLQRKIATPKVFAGKPAKPPFADDKQRVHFFIAEGPITKERKWPTESVEDAQLFPFIASEIMALNLELSNIAVLVKDRFQGRRLQEWLQTKQIPSVIRRSENLLETPAYWVFKDLLEALLDPDASSLKKILAGPFFGFNCYEISGGMEKSELQILKSFLEILCETLAEKGFGRFVDQFFRIAPFPVYGDAALFRDFRQLSEVLMEADCQTPEEALRYFQEHLERDIEGEESLTVKLVREEAVQILTMHMSKGLEFDVVFAIGVASRHVHREELLQVENRIIEWDLADRACSDHMKELESEKLRQFYVALTRAKQRVYVPWIRDLSEKPLELGAASPLELFFAKWLKGKPLEMRLNELIAQGLSFSFKELPGSILVPMRAVPANTAVEDVIVLPETEPELLLSFSALAQKKEREAIAAPGPEQIPLGSETGDIIHRILEKAVLAPSRVLDIVAAEIERTHLADWKEPVVELVNQALQLPMDGFRLIEAEGVRPEMEFLYDGNKNLIKGFIDLVMVHQGKYYFLDWKTNYLESYDTPTLMRAMEENDYFLQASIYANALKRYFAIFNQSLQFGGAFYVFLRGSAVYHFFPRTEHA